MDAILQSLTELSGVTAAMIYDGSGQLLGHRGHAVYDRAVCEHVGAALAKALDAVQLQQEDWETLTAHFADGKLVLRRVNASGRMHVLAVVADGSLNPSFATVAIRVAAGKLRRWVEGGPSSSAAAPSGAAGPSSSQVGGSRPGPAPGPGGSQPLPSPSGSQPFGDSRPNLAGNSWSRPASSSVSLSRVAFADPSSGAFLAACAKELAKHVGPIAKVYVEEAVRRVSPDAPFAMTAAAALVQDLAAQIEDPADQQKFQKACTPR
jgi:hypothetical protein